MMKDLMFNAGVLMKMTHILMTKYSVDMKAVTPHFGYFLIIGLNIPFASHCLALYGVCTRCLSAATVWHLSPNES